MHDHGQVSLGHPEAIVRTDKHTYYMTNTSCIFSSVGPLTILIWFSQCWPVMYRPALCWYVLYLPAPYQSALCKPVLCQLGCVSLCSVSLCCKCYVCVSPHQVSCSWLCDAATLFLDLDFITMNMPMDEFPKVIGKEL